MKRIFAPLIASAILILALASPAFAHVEVSPTEVRAGESARLSFSVPTELDVPTTEIRVEIPDGFEVESVDDAPGWSSDTEAGNITAVTWSGGEIPVEGSGKFSLEATAPDSAGEFRFRAIQTYGDGTVVEWVGAEDSNEPAPVVRVTEKPSEGDEGRDSGHHEHGSGATTAGTNDSLPDSGGGVYFALLGGVAMMLLGAGLLRRKP